MTRCRTHTQGTGDGQGGGRGPGLAAPGLCPSELGAGSALHPGSVVGTQLAPCPRAGEQEGAALAHDAIPCCGPGPPASLAFAFIQGSLGGRPAGFSWARALEEGTSVGTGPA